MEILTDGRQVMVEPSVIIVPNKKMKKKYKWINSPFDSDIIKLPDELKELLINTFKQKIINNNNKDKTIKMTKINNIIIPYFLKDYPIISVKEKDKNIYYCLDKSEKGRYCPFEKETHIKNNTYIMYNNNKLRYEHRCYCEICKGKHKTLRYNDKIEKKLNIIYKYGINDRIVAELARIYANNKFIYCQNDWWFLDEYGKVKKSNKQCTVWNFLSDDCKFYIIDILKNKCEIKNNLELLEENNEMNMEESLKHENLIVENIKQIELLNKLLDYFQSNSLRKRIIDDLVNMLDRTLYLDKIDKNPHIIGFENGVYDLKEKRFRLGTIDDLCSFSTGYDYTEKRDEEINKEIHKFFNDIFSNPKIKNYFLLILSSMMEGYNYDNIVMLWEGYGANGKGKVRNLMDATFKDYSGEITSSYISNKIVENPKSPDPQMVQSFQKRWIYISEPKSIDCDTFKRLSGMDPIPSRQLYSNKTVRCVPQFQFNLQINNTNNMRLDDPTSGCKRRLRVIPFDTKFKDNPDPNNPNEKQKDKNIEQKFKFWRMEFFHILLEYYYKYKKIKSIDEITPKCIWELSDQFINESNPYSEFIKEFVEPSNNKTDFISLMLCFQRYKEWFQINEGNYTNFKHASKKQLRVAIESKLTIRLSTIQINKIKYKNATKGYKLKEMKLKKFPDDSDDDTNGDEYF